MSWPLPTPADAMQQAVERAQLGEWDGARVWLDIARELRIGAAPAGRPLPRPLDDRSEPVAPIVKHVEHEDALGGYVGEQSSARIQRLSVPAEEPAYRSAETQVMQYDLPGEPARSRCGACSHEIELNFDNVPATWKHVLTQQAVCPVSDPGQTHSFAAPLVDRRG